MKFFAAILTVSIFAATNAVAKSDMVTFASWYDASGLNCATWDYPLGTKLRVTELVNGLSVVVTVNDRGPARRLVRAGRRIDLSAAAFAQLDGLELGIAKVKVEVVK